MDIILNDKNSLIKEGDYIFLKDESITKDRINIITTECTGDYKFLGKDKEGNFLFLKEEDILYSTDCYAYSNITNNINRFFTPGDIVFIKGKIRSDYIAKYMGIIDFFDLTLLISVDNVIDLLMERPSPKNTFEASDIREIRLATQEEIIKYENYNK